MEKLHGSRTTSPSRADAAASSTSTVTATSSSTNNGKKSSETASGSNRSTPASGTSTGRRRSPLPARRLEGGGATAGTSGGRTPVPETPSLALPTSPSLHSAHSASEVNAGVHHHNHQPAAASTPAPAPTDTAAAAATTATATAAAATAAAATATAVATATGVGVDDPLASAADDDPEFSLMGLVTDGGGGVLFGDDPDGTGNSAIAGLPPGTPEYQKIRLAMEQIHAKVNKTRELIRDEQVARDANVNEYLRLSAQADKQQQTRLKAVFEKKNTKSAQQMAHYQRKLESYQRRLRALEDQGAAAPSHLPGHAHSGHGHRAPKQVLRDVGHGIKTVMWKPREFAHLIRNRFGSADNINNISRNGDAVAAAAAGISTASASTGVAAPTGEDTYPGPAAALTPGQSNSLPGHGSQGTASGGVGFSTGVGGGVAATTSQGSGGGKYTSEEGSECGSSVTSESIAGGLQMSSPRRHHHVHGAAVAADGLSLGLESVFQELQERREENDRLREEMEHVKQNLQQEVSFLGAALQEERFRVERLEEQINDLTELHQNEVENLKQNIGDMEEKVQYQSEERLRDIHELLETCSTRISKVEHQAQHQQHVSLEGIENSNARAVLVKLINMALTLLQLVLVVVSTAANIISPFLKTRLRVVTSCVLALLFAFVLKQWPDLVDLGSHLIQHYKAALTS